MSIQTAVRTLSIIANAGVNGDTLGFTVTRTKAGAIKPVRSLVAIEASKQHRRDKLAAYKRNERARQRERGLIESHARKLVNASVTPDNAPVLTPDESEYRSKLLSKAAIYGVALDAEAGAPYVRSDGSHARHSKDHMHAHTLLSLSRPQGFSNAQGNKKQRSQRVFDAPASFTAMASKFAENMSESKHLIDFERARIEAYSQRATLEHNQALNAPVYHVPQAFDSNAHESLWFTIDGSTHHRKPRNATPATPANVATLQAIRIIERARRHADDVVIPSDAPVIVTEHAKGFSVSGSNARNAYQFLSRCIEHLAQNLIVTPATPASVTPDVNASVTRPPQSELRLLADAVERAHAAIYRARLVEHAISLEDYDGLIRAHADVERARARYADAKQLLADAMDLPVSNLYRARA